MESIATKLPAWWQTRSDAPTWSLQRLMPRRFSHRRSLQISIFALCTVLLMYWFIEREGIIYETIQTDSDFDLLPVAGFVNTGKPGKISCDSIRHEGSISVQQSFSVDDDIHKIAEELKDHPMIDYKGQDAKLTHEQIVEKTWLRMAQSSVWLEKFQVYLAITRVIFYDKGVRNWPVMSFLRGQLYTADWIELNNHTIAWKGEQITFPTTFNIPAPYSPGGGFYGPEDPRVLIEDDCEDAEPVVIFNMVGNVEKSTRSMFIFRPFSNATMMLSIVGRKPEDSAEKNWMPFFYNHKNGQARGRWPNHFLHFVYEFRPLKILKCHLLNGWCDWVYVQQDIPEEFRQTHSIDGGVMRGGTNFVLMRAQGEVQSFIGFPRTHVDRGCKDPSYRPELMVLTGTSPTQFHIDYSSEPMDFSTAAMTPQALQDPCGEGRILIANSISDWDRGLWKDTMTVSFSVDDVTTQILRLKGVQKHLESLPGFPTTRTYDSANTGKAMFDLQWSAMGLDVLSCSIESARNYTVMHAEKVNGTDLRKQREEQEKLEKLAKLKPKKPPG